ncbi:alpha-L-fucosidase [uncultured Draconibacterium sp.]|uniref:alpha-L-fucosidase n=1 Tax=uncultured Draconibacterium sp. TaxID=1573823 RepID=UPI0025DAF0BD|nr:alpha-L-fucosidase [uncultured Draconibacterium sp.]
MHKMYTMLLLIAILVNGCQSSTQQENDIRFEANWESLKEYKIPEWFADAKFGIFIHWGVYSVPAYASEWYPRNMYQDSVLWHQTDPEKSKPGTNSVYTHHVETYGHPSEFGYKDFIPMFKAEKFDADQWIHLFKKAGAKYVIPVAEHHDAFAMYKSNVTRWNSVEMGPKRDIVGELQQASKKEGMHFGVSSHFAFNWDYFNKEERFDTWNPEYEDLYGPKHERYAPVSKEFMDLWWRRTTDIIDSYQPEILWFDFYIDRKEFAPYHPKLAAYYYNKGLETGQEVVLQTKNMYFESFPAGSNVLDIERGKLSDIRSAVWQTDTSIGKNSWCHTEGWQSKSANSLIDDLIDIVSKNGTMLLNVGPKADGTIPQDQVNVLLEMGKWLDANGEAIYGTRPWDKFGEGPTIVKQGHHSEGNNKAFTAEDIRFTKKDKILYAITLDVPEDGKVLIRSLANHPKINANTVKSVEFLGEDAVASWNFTGQGLLVETETGLKAENALAIKIEVDTNL